jgi:agmatinase
VGAELADEGAVEPAVILQRARRGVAVEEAPLTAGTDGLVQGAEARHERHTATAQTVHRGSLARGGGERQTAPMTFDPDGPALATAGLYGLPFSVDEAAAVVIPVPFEATVSFRTGTKHGPAAIDAASRQVDLLDADFGRVYGPGIAMAPVADWIATSSDDARVAAMRVIEAHEQGEAPAAADIALVDAAGARINAFVEAEVGDLLARGKIPVVVGGDHSVPLGAIVACARHVEQSAGGAPLGVLHLDAHLDLRDAYEGFRWSHASIMKNVLDAAPSVRLFQIGLRDFSAGELALVRDQPFRIQAWFDAQLREPRLRGRFLDVVDALVAALPRHVYLSFDIDGLDPTLCPSTGTPVPGGLSFDEIVSVLVAVARSGRIIVGLDLVEVAPPPDAVATGEDGLVDEATLGDCWDANVGARLLYKMIGCAFASRGLLADTGLPKPPGI